MGPITQAWQRKRSLNHTIINLQFLLISPFAHADCRILREYKSNFTERASTGRNSCVKYDKK
jgi:hypothetical protein